VSQTILDLIKKRNVLFDGGMGTELMRLGFSQGECPELWNDMHPDRVRSIHQAYFDAGADAVLTNSFGGSRIKLQSYGLAERCFELNEKAARLVNSARPDGRFVGGSLGPTGHFLEPLGTAKKEDFISSYSEQCEGLAAGGVDFFLIETQYSLDEALCAYEAARKSSNHPICVTLTFNQTPKGFFTMMGHSLKDFVESFSSVEVAALGANCTLNSSQIADLILELHQLTDIPLIAQANAGQPIMDDEGNVSYDQGFDEYVKHIPRLLQNGARIIGGCCGTNPDYIKKMASIIHS